MTWEIAFVFLVVIGALVAFATERWPIDQVAVSVPVILLLAGIITPAEAVSGLSNEGTVTVAGMLVLSLGLVKTGAISRVAKWARSARLGGPATRVAVLCTVVAAISPFLNNTAVVAAFLPVFLAVARTDNQAPSRYLIPLSYAAILGGTVTLIGTSSNLVVFGMVEARGLNALSIFSIAPLGIIYLAVGLAYMFTVGRFLLPNRPGEADLASKYEVRNFLTELVVTEESRALGKTPARLGWEDEYDVGILGIERHGHVRWGSWGAPPLLAGDVLLVEGATEALLLAAEKEKLDSPVQGENLPPGFDSEDARFVEILIGPDSSLIGRTIRNFTYLHRLDTTVMAVQRRETTLRQRLGSVRLAPGDLLLVYGPAEALAAMADIPGLIPLGEVKGPVVDRPKAAVAVGILVGVVVTAGLGLLSIMTAVLAGVATLLFTGCVRLSEIYEELDWMVVFLLAGLIPLGAAMDNTGAASMLGTEAARATGNFGPTFVVAGIYLITSLLTEVMVNIAAAIVLTPIAIMTAEQLGMNPYALIVTVMFASSASFMTPMGYQTNTLIYGPGGYRFTDYIKVGLPLNLILMILASALIPIFWPS